MSSTDSRGDYNLEKAEKAASVKETEQQAEAAAAATKIEQVLETAAAPASQAGGNSSSPRGGVVDGAESAPPEGAGRTRHSLT